MKRVIALLMSALLVFGMTTSCKKNNTVTDNNGLVTNDALEPQEKDKVESAIDNFKPDKGYSYRTASDVASNVNGNLYELTDDTSSNVIGCVYISSSNSNSIEIDVNFKNCDDNSLKSALKMAVNTINSVYPDFDATAHPEFPFSFDVVKSMIESNEQCSDCIYSENLEKSISYEFFPTDGLLTFFIEY